MNITNGAFGGGALLGVILAAFGLRKAIRSEVEHTLEKKPSLQDEVTKMKHLLVMTIKNNNVMFRMHQEYVEDRLKSIQKDIELLKNSLIN